MSTGLRRFARPSPRAGEAVPDRCELCGETLGERHSHMVNMDRQALACACTACGLLFAKPGGRYRTVPDRVRHDPDAPLTAAEWAGLRIPVAMAFFMASSARGSVDANSANENRANENSVVASYPSAAGATECELDLADWDRLAAAHPLLRAAEPDVEAILVNAHPVTPNESADTTAIGAATALSSRGGVGASSGAAVEAFLVPVDVCYELAGALRLHWRGFDGGTEARRLLAEFLAGIRDRSRPLEAGDSGAATIR